MQCRIFIVGMIAFLVGCSTQVPPIEENGAQSSVATSIESSSSRGFVIQGGVPSGTVHVQGYAEQEIVVEPFCVEDFCPEYDYVFFNILESDSAEFDQFLIQNGGNAFGNDNRIGLGCVDDGQVVYENDSDLYGRKEFVLAEELSETILTSSGTNLVSLELTKLPLTGGAGAPACYSHFTTVEAGE